MCCAFFMCREITSGENPTEWLAFGGCLQTLALCTVCNFCRHFASLCCLSSICTMPSTPCCPRVAHFAFEVTLSLAIMLALLLVCSFAPRVHSIPRGPHILKKAHQDDVLFLLYGTIYGREPNRTVGVRRLLANACVCTVCNFADTLRRFVRSPCTRRHGNSFVKTSPPPRRKSSRVYYKL